MALKIINNRIVGTIDDLEEKLSGKLPIIREDLLVLVNSWGRIFEFATKTSNDQTLIIDKYKPKECYDLSRLDTSKITNMNEIFKNSKFNGDISKWEISNVTNMEWMFFNAKSFNQLVNFDTSKVTSMEGMFDYAENFNQPLNFNTSNVTNMSYMFCNARAFNQELNFDTSKVTNMDYMFYNTIEFNQPLNFDTTNVISMEGMFYRANIFNQPIIFDISKATIMSYMFEKTKAFLDKYNSGEPLPNYTNEIKEWIINNRERMNDIDLKDKYGEEIDMFFNKLQTNSIQKKEI